CLAPRSGDPGTCGCGAAAAWAPSASGCRCAAPADQFDGCSYRAQCSASNVARKLDGFRGPVDVIDDDLFELASGDVAGEFNRFCRPVVVGNDQRDEFAACDVARQLDSLD